MYTFLCKFVEPDPTESFGIPHVRDAQIVTMMEEQVTHLRKKLKNISYPFSGV